MLEASELNDLRQAVLRGEIIPKEKYRQIIESLRTKRASDIEAVFAKKDKIAAKKLGTTDEELFSILNMKEIK